MKTKLTILFLLFTAFAYQVSATTIVIIGGTKNNKFKYVRVDDRNVTCKYKGHNVCPVDWVMGGPKDRVASPTQQAVEVVLEMFNDGKTSGNINYNGDLPVSWRMIDEESVEITVFDKETESLGNYEINDDDEK